MNKFEFLSNGQKLLEAYINCGKIYYIALFNYNGILLQEFGFKDYILSKKYFDILQINDEFVKIKVHNLYGENIIKVRFK